MKKIFKLSVLLLCAAGITANAQTKEFKVKLTGAPGSQKIVIKNILSELHVVGTSAADITIQGSPADPPPDKARGLRKISEYGDDNTGIGLSVKQENGITTIAGTSNSEEGDPYTIQIPAGISLKLESESFNAEDITVENMSGELDIQANSSSLALKSVSGPMVLHTLNGSIDVVLSKLNQDKPTSISSVNGSIDVTLPVDSPATFDLSTINGEIYSDLDLKFDNADSKNMRHVGGGMKSNATNANGGVSVTISAINGNIYLRKK